MFIRLISGEVMGFYIFRDMGAGGLYVVKLGVD